uniref:Bm298 n=1 Tax=Brugia malayi TaxID=6279 RepID=A0A1I9G0N6_BRUMA|nr:Bm298 [Brugia malayi]
MLAMPIHQNIKRSIGFDRLISKYNSSSDSGGSYSRFMTILTQEYSEKTGH